MFQGDVVDQLHDHDGFAHARAAEQSDFSAAKIGLQQIDYLDAGLEHLQLGGLLVESRGLPMNGPFLGGIDGTHVVHRLADHVHDAAERFVSNRDFNAVAQADGLHPAHHAVGGLQRDGAHTALPDVLRHFHHHIDGDAGFKAFAGDMDGRVNDRDLVLGKLNVDGRAGHLDDLAYDLSLCCSCHKCPSYSSAAALFQCRSSAHNFNDLSGDTGLPHAVHFQCQRADDIGGVGA